MKLCFYLQTRIRPKEIYIGNQHLVDRLDFTDKVIFHLQEYALLSSLKHSAQYPESKEVWLLPMPPFFPTK